jgi:hypothetical protein
VKLLKHLQRGVPMMRCPSNKKTLAQFQSDCSKYGCTLLSTSYKNCKTPCEIQYPCGHTGTETYDTFYSKMKKYEKDKKIPCGKCGKKLSGVKLRTAFNEVADKLASAGCQLIEFTSKAKKIKFLCVCGEVEDQQTYKDCTGKLGIKCNKCRAKGPNNILYPKPGDKLPTGSELLEKIIDHNGKIYWILKCKCGNKESFSEAHVRWTENFAGLCKICSKEIGIKKNVGECNWNSKGFRGQHSYVSKSYVNSINQFERNKFGCNSELTPEKIYNQLEKQDFVCFATGDPIWFDMDPEHQQGSIDRIDNSLGHVDGNWRLVRPEINMMRKALTWDEFLAWCYLIDTYHKTGIPHGQRSNYLADDIKKNMGRYNSAKSDALERGLLWDDEFTPDEWMAKLRRSNTICPISGLEMSLRKISLDRIDNANKSYHQSDMVTQFTCGKANVIKFKYSMETIIDMADKVMRLHKNSVDMALVEKIKAEHSNKSTQRKNDDSIIKHDDRCLSIGEANILIKETKGANLLQGKRPPHLIEKFAKKNKISFQQAFDHLIENYNPPKITRCNKTRKLCERYEQDKIVESYHHWTRMQHAFFKEHFGVETGPKSCVIDPEDINIMKKHNLFHELFLSPNRHNDNCKILLLLYYFEEYNFTQFNRRSKDIEFAPKLYTIARSCKKLLKDSERRKNKLRPDLIKLIKTKKEFLDCLMGENFEL